MAIQLNVTSCATGVLLAEGGSSSSSMTSLRVVNANNTTGVRVNLTSHFWNAAQGSAWVFDGSTGQPTLVPVGVASSSDWVIPPASLVIFSGLGPAF